MRSKTFRAFCAMIGLGLLMTFMSDSTYGQCGTPGHKPCVKSYKTAKKRVVRKKKVVRRKRYARIRPVKLTIPPRDPNKFTVKGSDRYTIIGSPNNVSTGDASASNEEPPPPDYRGPVSNTYSIPKQIAGGVLNGKATSLPRPVYPPAARAVRASGAESVQVLIDERGNVISASAVSGHALLRAAAVQAARGAKFSPTRLSGQPVKISGIITYNFVP